MVQLAFVLFFGYMGQYQQAEVMGPARAWLANYEERVHEEFLSLEPTAYVAARAYQDLYWEHPERWFCVGHDREWKVVGEVRRPVGGSIMDQLAWGHAVRPDASFDELVASVQIERHVLDAQHCPELGEILDTIPAPSFELDRKWPKEIRFHPLIFELEITGIEKRLRVESWFEDKAEAKWFETSYRQLLTCAGREGADTKGADDDRQARQAVGKSAKKRSRHAPASPEKLPDTGIITGSLARVTYCAGPVNR